MFSELCRVAFFSSMREVLKSITYYFKLRKKKKERKSMVMVVKKIILISHK